MILDKQGGKTYSDNNVSGEKNRWEKKQWKIGSAKVLGKNNEAITMKQMRKTVKGWQCQGLGQKKGREKIITIVRFAGTS